MGGLALGSIEYRVDAENLFMKGGEKEEKIGKERESEVARKTASEPCEEGADKRRAEGDAKGGRICKKSASKKRKRKGGLRGNDAMKVASLARGQDDCHSHACILPECGMFCSSDLIVRAGRKYTIRFRHGCRVAQKTIYGFSEPPEEETYLFIYRR